MQFLAREKRGGLAACLLGICVIGEGGVVALSEADLVIRSSHARLASCGRATSSRVLGLRAMSYYVTASALWPPSYLADLIETAS